MFLWIGCISLLKRDISNVSILFRLSLCMKSLQGTQWRPCECSPPGIGLDEPFFCLLHPARDGAQLTYDSLINWSQNSDGEHPGPVKERCYLQTISHYAKILSISPAFTVWKMCELSRLRRNLHADQFVWLGRVSGRGCETPGYKLVILHASNLCRRNICLVYWSCRDDPQCTAGWRVTAATSLGM